MKLKKSLRKAVLILLAAISLSLALFVHLEVENLGLAYIPYVLTALLVVMASLHTIEYGERKKKIKAFVWMRIILSICLFFLVLLTSLFFEKRFPDAANIAFLFSLVFLFHAFGIYRVELKEI